jgi:hypothetical protein
MEGYDRLMLRDMFEIVPLSRELDLKKEYHEKFANGLKAEIPELFPTVRIIEDRLQRTFFKGPKTKLTFPGVREASILIFDLRDDGWNVMPRRRHVEIENKVMNILRKIYREKGQGVRNAQLTGALTGLPHGPESRIASMLSGIEGKNAYQQGDILKKQAGIQGADPDRKKYSGRRKTLRRKNLRSSRKNK